MAKQQFDFLRQYIDEILDKVGFVSLNEDTRAEFVPQFVAEAERRIGLALLPKLTEDSATELAALVQKPNVTAEELQTFWKTNVPDFSEVLTETLKNFTEEVKTTVAGIS